MEPSVRTADETSEGRDVALMPNRKQLRTWAGHGTGAICNGCGATIGSHEIEYEIELPQGSDTPSLNFHFACYRNWVGRGSRG